MKTLPPRRYMLCLRLSSARTGARPTERHAHEVMTTVGHPDTNKVQAQTPSDMRFSNCNSHPLNSGCFMLARCLMKFQYETGVHGESLPRCRPPTWRLAPAPSHTLSARRPSNSLAAGFSIQRQCTCALTQTMMTASSTLRTSTSPGCSTMTSRSPDH
jgi:hypothetical protein